MKKLNLKEKIILVVFLMFLVVGGLTIWVYSEKSILLQTSGNIHNNKDADKKVLAYLSNSNRGLINSFEDCWMHSSYYIYYDKTIEIESVYSYMNIDFTSTCQGILTDEDYDSFQKSLMKLTDGELNYEGCDGDAWNIVVYDEDSQEVVRAVSGYAYGNENIQKNIIPIIGKHDTTCFPEHVKVDDMPGIYGESDKVFLEFKYQIAEGYYDEYTLLYNGMLARKSCKNGNVKKYSGRIEEEKFKEIQFYFDMIRKGNTPVADNDGYAYTLYDLDGVVIAKATTDDTMISQLVTEIDSALYISD